MKYLSRPYKYVALAMVLAVGGGVVAAPPGALAQFTQIKRFMQDLNPLLSHSSAQGYLGVLVADVDNESAAKLKLKDVRGAVITLIDHDAPAGQAGLKVNDVVMGLNGQNVDSAEHFGRMLREIPAGHKISIVISRDGNVQTMAVQLVDRKVMEQAVWNKMNSGFHMPFFGSSLNVGALVEPLAPQMADYMGVPSGVMVKQVARKSEAAAAGLKAHDVIVRVGADAINTTADWDRALRANQGKPVQVSLLRDRKQQTVNLQVDSKHK